MIRRTLRWMLGAVGALAILLALSIIAVRVLLLQVPERRTELQAWVNRATGLDLRFGELGTRWSAGGPEIYAADVQVYAPNGGPLLARAEAVSISTDIKRMLTETGWRTGRVRLIGPELRLVRTATGLELEGSPRFARREGRGAMNSDALPTIALQIVDGRITVLDARPPAEGQPHAAGGAALEEVLRIRGLNLRLQRDRGRVNFAGELELPRRMGGQLRFDGSAAGRLDEPRSLEWTLRMAGNDLRLDPWGDFFSGRWRGLNPQGRVQALNITFSGRGLDEPQFNLAARFTGVGIDPVDRVPGLRGLAGEVSGTDAAGEVRLNAADFVLDMPYRFRQPLLADTAAGVFTWKRATVASSAPEQTKLVDAWLITGRQVRLQGAHGRASLDLELTVPRDNSSRILDLRGQFQDGALQEAWRYLPVDRLRNPKTVAWLDQAFRSGRAVSGEVRVSGPTRRFPFRNGEGEFHATCAVEDLTLSYGKDWPELQALAADVEFHNQGMTATLRSGRLNGMQIEAGARAHIADFRQAQIVASGEARGDLDQALGFLQASPIGGRLGESFGRLRGSGPLTARMELFLPIKQLRDYKVAVTADLGAAGGRDRLRLQDSEHELRGLRGRLRIENTRLIAEGLRASYLGGPMTIDLKPETDASTGAVRNVAHVRASTSVAALVRVLPVPEKVALGGTLEWRAEAHMTDAVAAGGADAGAARPTLTVHIDSDLRGVDVALPAPLGKSAAESRPLRLQVQWPQPDVAALQFGYGPQLRANLSFLRSYPHQARPAMLRLTPPRAAGAPPGNASAWRFARGAVRLGGGPARLSEGPGMVIEGAVDRLDLSGWLGLRTGKPGGRPLPDYLRTVDLRVNDLHFYGFRLPEVTASLISGPQAWSVSVDGPRSRGMVLVPFDLEGPEPLIINMTRLDLGQNESRNVDGGAQAPARQGAGLDPRRWPAVKVSIREFAAWNKQFGALRAELERAPDGLTLQSMDAQGASFTLTGSGGWTATDEGQKSTLALRLESTDVLQTLQRLGYGGSLAGEHGLAEFDLRWSGPPDGQLLRRIEGALHVEVEDGQLVSVQPGAGRVFGLMSVATLRRRLSLDFSDLTDKGLTFDDIRGDFTLRGGDAYTSNLLLRGPAAEIGVVGRTGLQARDYDQTAVVTGSFGQSLPVAGALAGGPAVGAALLVFSQIFKQPLKGMARGYYRITGPWDDPTVERVQAEDLKKAEGAARVIEGEGGGAS